MTDKMPFFIVGSGRSGTTLLRLILSGHSRIYIPPETWFIEDLVRALPLTSPLVPEQIDVAIDIMTKHYRWPDLEIDPEIFRDWARSLTAPNLTDILNLVYQHHVKKHGKQRFGDKTPCYIHIVPELDLLYPGAKFIHLVRDGRDVAISFIDLQWDRYYARDFEWVRAVRRRFELAPVYGDRFLDIKYEDLVSDPEPTVRRVCEFLGEEFEPQMLAWQHLRTLVPERELTVIHRGLNKPLHTGNVGVWRKRLSGIECFAMEACLQQYLQKLGYQLYFSDPAWRPLFFVTRWLLYLFSPILQRAIPALQRRSYLPKAIYL